MRQHARPALFLMAALALCIGLGPADFSFAQAPAANPEPSPEKGTAEVEEETEDLAEAAVQLDLAGSSPLIVALYQATRETKEKRILEKLDTARGLIGKSNLAAADSSGRTALHWAVFGSSYATKNSIQSAYANLAEVLLNGGVEINREDRYHETALDYLFYSPNFDMQTLLLEAGATSGFYAASLRLQQGSTSSSLRMGCGPTDLQPGMMFAIRLNTPVWSDRSRTGDPVEAVITDPVRNGDVLLAPGTKIQGTVLFAQKAPNKYSRPRLALDFTNIVGPGGKESPLYVLVMAVDNARESVRNGEILGIVQPHVSTKLSVALSAVGMANPAASYAIRGIQTAYGLSLRREIHYPAGTDLLVQVSRASNLPAKTSWTNWPSLAVKPGLLHLAAGEPVRTERADTPADLTNVLLFGTEQQVQSAFQNAGWALADARGFSSDLKALQATVRQSGYKGAPVSLLTLQGRAPDLVFQKSLNTFARRHHIRLWQQPSTFEGRSVWIGAATHDIGIGSSAAGTKWYHRIDPWIDRERELIKTDLLYTGAATGYALVDRPQVPRKSRNATGDDLNTDGKLLVLMLSEKPSQPAAEVTSRKTPRTKAPL